MGLHRASIEEQGLAVSGGARNAGSTCPGPNNSYIATLVERHTRYVMLARVAGKDTQTVVSALIKQAEKLPKELYKSLTWDGERNSRIIIALRWRPKS